MLFLKRYDYSAMLSKKLKRVDDVRIPRCMDTSE